MKEYFLGDSPRVPPFRFLIPSIEVSSANRKRTRDPAIAALDMAEHLGKIEDQAG